MTATATTTATIDTDKISDKIRKLLLISERNPSEAEAQAALTLAQDLAARYHLDMAQVVDTEQDPYELRPSDVELWSARGRQRSYRWQLAHVIAQAHGCAPWMCYRATVDLDRAPDESTIAAAFEGYSDAKRNEYTFTLTDLPDGGVRLSVTKLYSSCGPSYGLPNYFGPFGVRKHKASVCLVMVGRREIAQAAIYTYRAVLRAADQIAKELASGERRLLNSIRVGIVDGLRERLVVDRDEDEDETREFEADDKDAVKTQALVLTQAADASERYLADAFGAEPYGGKPRKQKINRGAYLLGRVAADEIDVPDPNGKRTALGASRVLGVGDERKLGA